MNWKPADIAMVRTLAGGSASGGGVTPNVQATAKSLPAGSEAAVTRTGSNANPVFHFGIPEGKQGALGPAGADGMPGADATINGVNALEIVAGENITLEQQGDRLSISATGGGSVTQAELEKALSAKQDVLTAGDGISIEADAICVTTPVRGLTQAEYDRLPEGARRGLCVVTDAATVLPEGGEVYSTQETRIGSWIDGKPLYRRVYRYKDLVVNGTGTNSGETAIAEDVSFIDTLVSGAWNGSYTTGAVAKMYQPAYVIPTGIVLLNKITVGSPTIKDCCVILEYTRTGDQGVSE